jgi:hypothetical protein
MSLPKDFPFLRIGEAVQHKQSGMVGKVTGFAHPSTDVMVDHSGPYPQMDFVRLVPEDKDSRPKNDDGSSDVTWGGGGH